MSGLFGFMDFTNKDALVKNINETFNDMQNIIDEVFNIVSMPIDNYSGLWRIFTDINRIVIPVGLSLMTLFFLIGFLTKAASFKLIRMENIIKMLIMLIIAKYVMQNGFQLLQIIYNLVGNIIYQVGTGTSDISELIDAKQLVDIVYKMNWVDRMMFQLQFFCIWLVLFISNILIKVICYGRIIEVCLFTAISPLPLATIASEEYANIAKRFMQHYVAVCLQGLIILISCKAYGGLASTIIQASGDINIGTSICITFVLLFVIMKSESWAQKISGT